MSLEHANLAIVLYFLSELSLVKFSQIQFDPLCRGRLIELQTNNS